ncbi:MAG: hypothetical protein AAGB04_31720 [Pseudomonadota bacterium]
MRGLLLAPDRACERPRGHVKRGSNLVYGVAASNLLDRFINLVRAQLWRAPEMFATGFGSGHAFFGALDEHFALKLSESRDDGVDQHAARCVCIDDLLIFGGPGVGERRQLSDNP